MSIEAQLFFSKFSKIQSFLNLKPCRQFPLLYALCLKSSPVSGRHCLMSTFELFLFHFQDSEAGCCHSGKFYSLNCTSFLSTCRRSFMHIFLLPIDMFKGGVPVSILLILFQPTCAKTMSKSRSVDKISKLYLNVSKWFYMLVTLSKQKTWKIVGYFYAVLNTTLSRQ